MFELVVKRVIATVPVLIGVTIIIFFLIRLIPGDVVEIMVGNQDVSPERIAYLRELYGVDRPILPQYFHWLSRVVQGDLGTSIRLGRPIIEDVLSRFPVTMELAFFSVLISLSVAVPLGTVSAIKQNTLTDNIARLIALAGLSIPNFWLGTMLVLAVSLYVPWMTPSGFVPFFTDPLGNIKTMILPAISLGAVMMGSVARMTRSCVLEVLRQDYVVTARSKGLAEQLVIVRHVLKNAFIPVITVIGMQTGFLLGGTVIVESIFAVPGMGTLALGAIYQRDYPVVQASVMILATTFVCANFIVDLLYQYFDPRIRYH